MEEYKGKVTINKEVTDIIIKVDKEKKYLYYIEKDSKKTVTIFDYKEKILKRDNEDMYLELDFKKKKNKMLIKSLNREIELILNTKKINISKNKIEIEYNLNDDNFTYRIEGVQI